MGVGMKSYEGMFIFKPDLDKEGLDKALNQVREIFEKHKGSQAQVKEWGKQNLAYQIKKYKEGFYYLISFHIDPGAIGKLKRAYSLNESILRVLITEA